MKVQCDVCERKAAAVICCADEAALCAGCDVEIHAANKLAGKHQRLPLDCLSTKLPRCDICREKAAFIFCVEDRALFCRDCDEPIHVPGTLSGDHQRYLATGIRVGLSSLCNKDPAPQGRIDPPGQNPAVPAKNLPVPAVPESFAPSAWAVDEFLQLSDYESSDKMQKGSPLGFRELEWFADIGLFHDHLPNKGATTILTAAAAAAEVPELPPPQSASNAAFFKPGKTGAVRFKKQRIEHSDDDDEDYLTVPDLG